MWGLFFYDIFWVYGTEVMVTVAKSFDGPIKLLFPIDWETGKKSMLGLGDIVIPGVFVTLALKYDIDHRLKSAGKDIHSVATPYFNFCFGGYVVGICYDIRCYDHFQSSAASTAVLSPNLHDLCVHQSSDRWEDQGIVCVL